MRSIPAALENQANPPCRGASNRVDFNWCRNASDSQIDPCIAIPALKPVVLDAALLVIVPAANRLHKRNDVESLRPRQIYFQPWRLGWEIISQAVVYGEDHPRFDTTVGNRPSAQNPGLVDKRCRQLESLHQGALQTAGEFSDDVLLLSRGDFLMWHSRIAWGAQRLGRESRDNLSNTYTPRKPYSVL
jgi:hypothetical protein